MVTKRHGISPDLLIHPGETISDILEERSLTQKELAERAGVSEPFLSDVIRGKKDISKSLAMGLEYALGVRSSFWLNLQANYDAELLSLQEEETVQEEEKEVLKTIHEVVRFLFFFSLIPKDLKEKKEILQLRYFFKVSSLLGLRRLAPAGAFRMSGTAAVNNDVLGAWLCMCKVLGENSNSLNNFDATKTGRLIGELKGFMCNAKGDIIRALPELLSQYGIDFSVVHNFRGAPVHGYIEREKNGTYQMVLTIRGSYAYIFWFSLFHELGHIVNGDLNRTGRLIDTDAGANSERETRADRFAEDALLDPDSYKEFIKKGDYSLTAIRNYAKSQSVPAFIAIGRLQKDKLIPWNRFTRYKPKYSWLQ